MRINPARLLINKSLGGINLDPQPFWKCTKTVAYTVLYAGYTSAPISRPEIS